MRPDPTFFRQLLGERDWAACRLSPLGGNIAPLWDKSRSVLTLPHVRPVLPPTTGEKVLMLAARRAAAADANGNIYWIGDDAKQLLVRAFGTRRPTTFWPDARAYPKPTGVFSACPPPRPDSQRYTGMALSCDAWLIVSFEDAEGPTGLELFDLVGGGAPAEYRWPASEAMRVRDLAAGQCSDIWLLDDSKRLFRLNRRLAVKPADADAELEDLFQPTGGEPRTYVPASSPRSVDLGALDPAIDPISIELLPDGSIAILSREAGKGRIYVLDADGGGVPFIADVDLESPQDMAFGAVRLRDQSVGQRLIVSGGSGNQAVAFLLPGKDDPAKIKATSEILPMRRYGGRALLSAEGTVHYDSGDTPIWTPLAERPQASFETSIQLVTPIFDSSMPSTVWDRVRFDACIPPGTKVQVAAWAGEDDMPGEWIDQPLPILSSTGSEFAGYDPAAVPSTDPIHGKGNWELLLQGMRGRFLQLRLTLIGNGSRSPELRALRAWFPRQSWSEQHLPAVYRADPVPADFLDRFLANMEGTIATIERRIVDAQAIFDPRIAPKEGLGWLASWFDVALDPAWNEAQQRLFIKHAAHFLSLRGTKRGVETALALAFTPCADERLFDDPQSVRTGIRITENFLIDSLQTLARSAAPGSTFWSPDEDNLALADRIAVADGRKNATADERAQPVAFYPPEKDGDDWPQRIEAALGFVPTSGAAERRRWQQFQLSRGRPSPIADLPRGQVSASYGTDWDPFLALASRSRKLWQDFLRSRHGRIARLNAAHSSAWVSFDEISLFDHLPSSSAARKDWYDFETKVLTADASAHRFTVLLPVRKIGFDTVALARDRELARRIVEMEKPAHTTFDVRFYFAMNRIGEARLGFDTTLGQGSRDPDLLPQAILGRAYFGESFIGPDGPPDSDGRRRLAC